MLSTKNRIKRKKSCQIGKKNILRIFFELNENRPSLPVLLTLHFLSQTFDSEDGKKRVIEQENYENNHGFENLDTATRLCCFNVTYHV